MYCTIAISGLCSTSCRKTIETSVTYMPFTYMRVDALLAGAEDILALEAFECFVLLSTLWSRFSHWRTTSAYSESCEWGNTFTRRPSFNKTHVTASTSHFTIFIIVLCFRALWARNKPVASSALIYRAVVACPARPYATWPCCAEKLCKLLIFPTQMQV